MNRPLTAADFRDASVIPHRARVIVFTDTADKHAAGQVEDAFIRHLGALGEKHQDVGLYTAAVAVRPALDSWEIGSSIAKAFSNPEKPPRLLIEGNFAPPNDPNGTRNNARKNFYYAELDDGTLIGTTLNGYELSFVRDRIKTLYEDVQTNTDPEATTEQKSFRSRSILPKVLSHFAVPLEREKLIADGRLVARDARALIPELPNKAVVYEVDQPFENVKLVIPTDLRERLKAHIGKRVRVTFTKASAETALRGAAAVETTWARSFKIPYRLVKNWVEKQRNTHSFLVTEHLFDAKPSGKGTDVAALHCSSTLPDGQAVPIISSMRFHPTHTRPNFRVPREGTFVHFHI